MCNNYQELDFTHFVVITSEGEVFGSARQNGRIYNFLIRSDGAVRTQNGGDWLDLDPATAQIVRGRAEAAYTVVPTYRLPRFFES